MLSPDYWKNETQIKLNPKNFIFLHSTRTIWIISLLLFQVLINVSHNCFAWSHDLRFADLAICTFLLKYSLLVHVCAKVFMPLAELYMANRFMLTRGFVFFPEVLTVSLINFAHFKFLIIYLMSVWDFQNVYVW